jgi:hypothetical protein
MGAPQSKCEKEKKEENKETKNTSKEDGLPTLGLNESDTENPKRDEKRPMPFIENEQPKNQSGGDANNYTFEKYNIFKVLHELENMDAKTVMEGGQEINFNSTTDDLKVMTKLKNAVNSNKTLQQKGGIEVNKKPLIRPLPNLASIKPVPPTVNPYKINQPNPTTQKGGNVENVDKNNFKTYLLDELNAQKGGGSKCATCNQSGGCGCEQSGGKKSKKSSSSSSDSSSSDSSSSSTSSSSSSSSSTSSSNSNSEKVGGTSNDSYSRGLHIFPFQSSITDGGDSSYSSNHKLLRRHL